MMEFYDHTEPDDNIIEKGCSSFEGSLVGLRIIDDHSSYDTYFQCGGMIEFCE